MHIEDFNTNTSRNLAVIVASGEPEPVTRYRKDYAIVTAADLFDELLQAAGKRGQEVLKRHREAADQQKQETAA